MKYCEEMAQATADALNIKKDEVLVADVYKRQLYTKNPLYSAPKGYSDTYGYKKITAKCTVSKSGYTTRSVSSSKSLKSGFGGVETDWISGPTYKSSGTKFVSKHTDVYKRQFQNLLHHTNT